MGRSPLSYPSFVRFWVAIRTLAEERLVDLQVALENLVASPAKLSPVDRTELLREAARGEVVVIDVRPEAEYAAGHLPFARSIPLAELKKRIAELPRDKAIVAYCRGPFCLMSEQAVKLLAQRGYQARKITDGVAEWQAAGLPLESAAN